MNEPERVAPERFASQTLILTFIAESTPVPIGGVAMLYEFASHLADRGHRVHLFHIGDPESAPSRVEEIGWYTFRPGVEHHFRDPRAVDVSEIPSADVIFGHSEAVEANPRLGLPAVFIQGYRMLGEDDERRTFHAPCPKICVASWLVEVGTGMGVPRNELVHVPLGLDHSTYRLTAPLEDRPKRVSFCYSPHPQKGAELALDVLEGLREAVPGLLALAFGASAPEHDLPRWLEYRQNPDRRELVEDIYNQTRLFLCTSNVEGFGLTPVEAMACGAALVTTDSGGSRDYALHGRTALVAARHDRQTLVDHGTALLGDEPRRLALAAAGHDHVQRFNWPDAARALEGFLERYLADPAGFGRVSTAPPA